MSENPSNNVAEIMFVMNQDTKKRKPKLEPIKPKQEKLKNQGTGKTGSEEQATPPKPDSSGEVVRQKSMCRKISIGLIITLSAVIYGYGIKQITAINIDVLVSVYNISIDKFIAQSILIGILPIMSIPGAFICTCLIKKFRRLFGIYIFTFVNVGAVILVNINTFYTLLIGRALQGVCIGYYSAIAPMYLRQIAPKELRRLMGLFFSFGKMVGVMVAIIVQLILVQALNLDIAYRIILSLTAAMSVLQAVLIFCFGSQTPTQLLERGDKDEARQVIKKFYKDEHVEDLMSEYQSERAASVQDIAAQAKAEIQKKKNKKKKKKGNKVAPEAKHFRIANQSILDKSQMDGKEKDPFYQSQFDVKPEYINDEQTATVGSLDSVVTQKPHLTFEQKKDKAYLLGVHMAGIKNFIGANAIITQGGIFISLFNKGLGDYTSLIVNIIQFIAIVFGMLYVQKHVGKKHLFLLSLPILSMLNFALVLAMIYENVTALLFLMCLFLAVFGAAYISPMWAYPPEIIPAKEQTCVNVLHWFSIAFVMLIPPLVASFMPGNNPYPCFIFFGIYGFIGFAHVRSTLRESDGRTYKEIIEDFR